MGLNPKDAGERVRQLSNLLIHTVHQTFSEIQFIGAADFPLHSLADRTLSSSTPATIRRGRRIFDCNQEPSDRQPSWRLKSLYRLITIYF